MIQQNTLFILGAGASQSFGYPSGNKLTKQIVEKMETAESAPILNTMMQQSNDKFLCQFIHENKNSFDELKEKLDGHLTSIDFFLNNHPEEKDWHKLGKYFTRMIIGSHNPDYKKAISDVNNNDRWFEYLFTTMSDGARSVSAFTQNPVKFITFNYDTSLEEAFIKSLYSAYPMKAHLEQLLRNFEIIHTYGTVPIAASGNEWMNAWDESAGNLRFIFEEVDNETRWAIDRHINWATQIVIMGFGFHSENLMFLRSNNWPDKMIYCSRLGLTNNQVSMKKSAFGPYLRNPKIDYIKFDNEERNCREFLREIVPI